MYKENVAVCSQINTKHSTQASTTYNVLMLNLVVRKETARL